MPRPVSGFKIVWDRIEYFEIKFVLLQSECSKILLVAGN